MDCAMDGTIYRVVSHLDDMCLITPTEVAVAMSNYEPTTEVNVMNQGVLYWKKNP
ncbi:hypothetical protein DPMN_019076, partial [Dreissena polymorpha]